MGQSSTRPLIEDISELPFLSGLPEDIRAVIIILLSGDDEMSQEQRHENIMLHLRDHPLAMFMYMAWRASTLLTEERKEESRQSEEESDEESDNLTFEEADRAVLCKTLNSVREEYTCCVCFKLKKEFVMCLKCTRWACCTSCLKELKNTSEEETKCPRCRSSFTSGLGRDFIISNSMETSVTALKDALKKKT